MSALDDIFTALQDEISGLRALDTGTAVARFDRIIGSSDFAAATELLATQLRAYGLDEVCVEAFPIDGVQTYMGRVFGPAYQPRRARLTCVAPTPYVICDYAETPMCLPSGAPATPPEGVTAAIVDVGRGDRPEDYVGVDVAGKAVLATGLTTNVYNLAVEEYGAACVMTTNMYDWSDLPEVKRSMLDLPDATHLARLYYDAHKRRPAPVFSISYRHAEALRRQLQHGTVKVHAVVEAESKPGDLLVVTATIRGSDLADEEVWMMAHLCHPKPGACDNGSGVALGVELFRTMATLIRQERLARPRRTLRLLLLPEVSGTQAYMDRHQARLDKVVAGINLDMVGAHFSTGAYCRLVQTPWSRPSFLNRLGAYLLARVSYGAESHIRHVPVRNWLYTVAPYDKGSDHDVLLNSRFGIPSVFFFYWPYRYYHTSHDTPDKLDPAEFAKTGVVAGGMALAAAAMTADLAGWLVDLIGVEASYEIASMGHDCGIGAPSPMPEARLASLVEMELGTIRSVGAALPAAEQRDVAAKVADWQAEITRLSAPFVAAQPDADDGPAPHRLDPWPLNLSQIEARVSDAKTRLDALRAVVPDFDDKAIAALNYVDGTRNVQRIAWLVTGEIGGFGMEHAAAWFDLLAEGGIVTWSAQ